IRPALEVRRVGVENADRNFLTDLNRSLPVVERHDARLGLKIGETNFLERVEEAGKLELAEGCREYDAERRIDDARVGVGDCRQRRGGGRGSSDAGWPARRCRSKEPARWRGSLSATAAGSSARGWRPARS